ncbi:MAG: hypothetical protein NT065_05070 [Chlamydiae bacterium]|nr:hypothetical protein [Chlamydiota bacterium]
MAANPVATRTCNSILRETIYANVYHTALSGAGLYAMYTLVDKSNPAAPTYLMGTAFAERCINLISSINGYALMDTSELTPAEFVEAHRANASDATQGGSDAGEQIDTMLLTQTGFGGRVRNGTSSSSARPADHANLERINHQGLLNRYNRMYQNFYNRSCMTLGTVIVIGIFGNKENRNSFYNLFSNAG